MRKTIILIIALVTFDAVVNVATCFLGKKQAKIDKDLTDALLANRDAVMKRNELLEQEANHLKSIIEMITKKQEKEVKQDGKEEGEPNI